MRIFFFSVFALALTLAQEGCQFIGVGQWWQ